jgi:hypothetical protein
LTEAFVQSDSPVVGKTLQEAGLTRGRGVRVLEIVRDGIALYIEPHLVKLKAGDRLILSCRPKGIAHTRRLEGIDLATELGRRRQQRHLIDRREGFARHDHLAAQALVEVGERAAAPDQQAAPE